MSIAVDIFRAWRRPRLVMHRHLSQGVREDRALVFLITGCLLMFIAQLPRLWRDAVFDPTLPFDARIGGALLGWIFLAPLALYLVAALGHLLAKLLGGQGTWFSARIALFWALLVSSPIWLLNGLVAGLIGPGALMLLTGSVAMLMFAFVWFSSALEAEKKDVTR